jgi:hypothetical protein
VFLAGYWMPEGVDSVLHAHEILNAAPDPADSGTFPSVHIAYVYMATPEAAALAITVEAALVKINAFVAEPEWVVAYEEAIPTKAGSGAHFGQINATLDLTGALTGANFLALRIRRSVAGDTLASPIFVWDVAGSGG